MSEEIRILTVKEIEDAQDIVTEMVLTPEWGEGTGIVVRGLSLQQLDEIQEDTKGHEGDDRYAKLRLIQAGVAKPKLTHKDYAMLLRKSVAPIVRIINKINELSGLTEIAEEEARKNLSSTGTSDSSTN